LDRRVGLGDHGWTPSIAQRSGRSGPPGGLPRSTCRPSSVRPSGLPKDAGLCRVCSVAVVLPISISHGANLTTLQSLHNPALSGRSVLRTLQGRAPSSPCRGRNEPCRPCTGPAAAGWRGRVSREPPGMSAARPPSHKPARYPGATATFRARGRPPTQRSSIVRCHAAPLAGESAAWCVHRPDLADMPRCLLHRRTQNCAPRCQTLPAHPTLPATLAEAVHEVGRIGRRKGSRASLLARRSRPATRRTARAGRAIGHVALPKRGATTSVVACWQVRAGPAIRPAHQHSEGAVPWRSRSRARWP
jgi:hypothetical protein